MTILYFALGGGLGHVARAVKVARALGWGDVQLVASTRSGPLPRLPGGRVPIVVPSEIRADRSGYEAWIAAVVARVAPSAICVDAFPMGLFGEWSSVTLPPGVERLHVARLLRWPAYVGATGAEVPRYDRVWTVEPLTEDHRAALAGAATRIDPLALAADPVDDIHLARARAMVEHLRTSAESTRHSANAPRPTVWLLVHTGPPDEVAELHAYGRSVADARGEWPVWALAHPDPALPTPEGLRRVPELPAAAFFPWVDRIVSAAGFNTMLETAHWAARNDVLPLPREFDNQFERAARRRSAAEHPSTA